MRGMLRRICGRGRAASPRFACRIFVPGGRRAERTNDGDETTMCGARRVTHLLDGRGNEKARVSGLHGICDPRLAFFVSNVICPLWQRDGDGMLCEGRNRITEGDSRNRHSVTLVND